jgi:hypothetical protein
LFSTFTASFPKTPGGGRRHMSIRPLRRQAFRCAFRIPSASAGASNVQIVHRRCATWTRAAHPTIIAVRSRFQVDG